MSTDRHSTAPNTEHLTVLGESKMEFVPDAVEVSVELSRIEETPSAAKANVDERASRVILLAKGLGVEPKDVRASHLTIAPHREYRNLEYHHKGYMADLQVDIKLRDITRFSRLVGQLVDVPVNRIVRIKTSLQDESVANQEALARAIEDARGKATRIAQQLGVQLGGVFSAVALPKEERFHIGGAAARASEEDATFEPGTIDVEARIEVTFYLVKPGPR